MPALIVLSSLTHVAVFFLLPTLEEMRELHMVLSLEVLEDEPEPVVEEAPPEPEEDREPEVLEPEPEPEPEIVRPQPRPDAPPEEPEEPEEQPAAAEEIVEFPGMTLGNDDGDASWSARAGSGEARTAPLESPRGIETGRSRRGSTAGTVGGTGTGDGPSVVPASNLSRSPGPPLDRMRRLLEQNYPRNAQELGVEGHATVRVRVMSDGAVRPLRLVNETHDGFGAACRRTIRQSGRWQPPLDRQGSAVVSDVEFRCTFTITL